jgi:DnaK suppressor protein
MTHTTRMIALKQMLSERRRELVAEVHTRIRDSRSGQPKEVRDSGEDSDAEHQGDVEFSLLQVRAETLHRIDEALRRLDAGKYGTCIACEGEISAPRLRALPFAVRCTACESRREHARDRARQLSKNGAFTLVADSATA